MTILSFLSFAYTRNFMEGIFKSKVIHSTPRKKASFGWEILFIFFRLQLFLLVVMIASLVAQMVKNPPADIGDVGDAS